MAGREIDDRDQPGHAGCRDQRAASADLLRERESGGPVHINRHDSMQLTDEHPDKFFWFGVTFTTWPKRASD